MYATDVKEGSKAVKNWMFARHLYAGRSEEGKKKKKNYHVKQQHNGRTFPSSLATLLATLSLSNPFYIINFTSLANSTNVTHRKSRVTSWMTRTLSMQVSLPHKDNHFAD